MKDRTLFVTSAEHKKIDAHCHVWDLSRGDYGWLDTQNTDLEAIARDFDFNDLQAADCKPGAAQYVVVQAAPTLDETKYLLQLAENNDGIGGVIGWVDLSATNAVTQLSQFCEHKKFKGIRPMLQDIDDEQWINTAPQADAINYLVAKGLTFDALVLPKHLSALLSFSVANPALPIVIDHAAKPALSASLDDARHAQWREGMALLAAETNASVKVSGLLTELSVEQHEFAIEILQPVLNDLVEWFGPERLMWGSDWPVVNLASSYESWYELSKTLLADLDASSQERIFSANAVDFYQLDKAA